MLEVVITCKYKLRVGFPAEGKKQHKDLGERSL